MIRSLVISDTHIPVTANALPSIIKEEAKRSDCCFYCGDCITLKPLKELDSLTTVYGVCGNMDDEAVRKVLPVKRIVKLENVIIALTHGGGSPLKIIEHVKNQFIEEYDKIDMFIFGHSHMPLNKEINGKIFFNPGSPTDQMFAPYRSYGILEIEDKTIKGRIVEIG